LDKELLKSLGDLLDDKLSPLKHDIKSMKDDINNINKDINNINNDIKNIKAQQEESISILKSLEHKADVNKSEHDKLFNDIANLSGTVENMRKDLSAVEVVTARNLENIAQLKLAK
jgi:predicted  nucleic acid-binding Zn-ribbon protein